MEARQGDATARGEVRLTIRPERVEIEPPGEAGSNRLGATVSELVYLGSTTQVFVRAPTGTMLQALVANTGQALQYERGSNVLVHLPPDALRVLATDEDGTS
jgi:spermidine/putrescine transport system ATP-binding protein